MALYYDLPVFKEVYKLILILFEVTKDFPKEYKYTLGHDIKRDGINFLRRRVSASGLCDLSNVIIFRIIIFE